MSYKHPYKHAYNQKAEHEARVSFLVSKLDKQFLTETLNFLTINFLSYFWGVVVIVDLVVSRSSSISGTLYLHAVLGLIFETVFGCLDLLGRNLQLARS